MITEKKEESYLSNGVRPKVNSIARLEFELAYHDVKEQHVSHNDTGTLPYLNLINTIIIRKRT